MGRTKNTKPTKKLVDVVIVTGGRFDMLKKCLKALEVQENASEINVFVVDNATDNKERLYNKDIFEMPVVTNSKRLTNERGFPGANNEGARLGSSKFILFLNDDVELEPDTIHQMLNTMKDKTIGIVGAKLLFPEGSTRGPAGRVQHIGLGMSITGAIHHPLVGWPDKHIKCNISREVIAVTGACLLIRRDLFKKIGGFDEVYGLGTYEDIELCFVARTLGFRTYINTNARGTHYTGATVEKKQRGYPLQQNALIFKARWAQSGLFAWTDYLLW